MHIKYLVGKKAIRTMHMTMAHGNIDRGFMQEPIFIKAVVEDTHGGGHIVCDWYFMDKIKKNYILPYEYIDNHWTDYDKLIAKANRKPVKYRKRTIYNMR